MIVLSASSSVIERVAMRRPMLLLSFPVLSIIVTGPHRGEAVLVASQRNEFSSFA